MTAGYDTLIVTFSDPICVLDRMFDCRMVVYRGHACAFVAVYPFLQTFHSPCRAVITSEYNTVHVVEWLRKHTHIAEMKEF